MKRIVTEKDIKEKAVKPWLKEIRAWEFMPVSNGMGKHGIPDHIACVPVTITEEMVGNSIGLFLGIEAKAPGKKCNVSASQQRQLDGIEEAYGFAVVVSCKEDLDDLKDFLLKAYNVS